jgi:hypothetical protein
VTVSDDFPRLGAVAANQHPLTACRAERVNDHLRRAVVLTVSVDGLGNEQPLTVKTFVLHGCGHVADYLRESHVKFSVFSFQSLAR